MLSTRTGRSLCENAHKINRPAKRWGDAKR